MDKGWIPRNLDEHDVIKFGMGINLSISDLPFIGSGGLLAYIVSDQISNMTIKVITVVAIIIVSYLVTKIKFQSQKTPELCMNGSIYTGRKVYYHRKRKELENPKEKFTFIKNLSFKTFMIKG